MPYVDQKTRAKFKAVQFPFKVSAELNRLSAGEINYIFSWIINRQLDNANYARYNEIIGALECCKIELYRRILIPYEDKKKKENGDVYDNQV